MEEEKKLEELEGRNQTPEAPDGGEEPQAADQAAGEGVGGNGETPQAETPPAKEPEPAPAPEQTPGQAAPEPVRTFTQEQVNALVGKARQEGREKGYEQARREALERYGVDDDAQLDALFANGTRYDELSSRYEDERGSLNETRTELALVKSGILPERQGDVRAILGANGMEVTVENIESLLPTHPEWKAAQTALPGQTPAPAPEIPQPQVEGSQAPADKGDLGPAPEPEKPDPEAAKAKEREEAMQKFGLRI